LNYAETAATQLQARDVFLQAILNIKIVPDKTISLETPPLVIEEDKEINWRISPKEKGVHKLFVIVGGRELTKKVSVAQEKLSKISPRRIQGNFIDEVFYPTERPIPYDSPIKTIEISYPPERMNLFGWRIHWLVAYFILSIVFGFAFKGMFKVNI